MKLLIYILIFIVGFVLFVFVLESKSVFFPSKLISRTPEQLGLDFEDVYMTIKQDQVTIHGWWVPKNVDSKTVVFLHGNAGNISDRLDKILLFNQLGLNVFIIDYRGYGKSEGKPSEQGMYDDSHRAYQYLIEEQKINPQSIIVYGASLGGAAAVDLAKNHEVGGLIVDSTFSSGKDMARHIFPFIPSFLVRTKLDSLSKIKFVKAPKLFFHSQEDTTVPYKLGRKLYEAADENKRFVDIQGGHNDGHIYSEEIFKKVLMEYLDGLK